MFTWALKRMEEKGFFERCGSAIYPFSLSYGVRLNEEGSHILVRYCMNVQKLEFKWTQAMSPISWISAFPNLKVLSLCTARFTVDQPIDNCEIEKIGVDMIGEPYDNGYFASEYSTSEGFPSVFNALKLKY
jgi:hypothetical protein